NDIIDGGAGNDTIYGDNPGDHYWMFGNDIIDGGAGDDTIYGGRGNDIIDGGAGDDILYGYVGHDIYKFGIGSGNDTINDYDPSGVSGGVANMIDTVEFGEGITKSDLELVKEGNDLRIKINGATDTLLITDWFLSGIAGLYQRIEQFKFVDGTLLSSGEIDSIGYKTYGTIGNDSLTGVDVVDHIYGYEGNDTINGKNGNDILDGGAGNDTIYGGYGNDIIDGGAGDDILYGEYSSITYYTGYYPDNDIYRFGIGSGNDTIYDANHLVGNIDTVEFGAGITKDGLEFVREGSNLRVTINAAPDTLLIKDWFGIGRIEQFKFADGTLLTSGEIDSTGYKVYGTAGNDSLSGYIGNDVIYGYEGNDTIYGIYGNDIIYGGAGDDILYGAFASPSYSYNEDNDTIYGGAGNDTIYGGEGNDIIDGGLDADNMAGGIGDDTYVVDNVGDIITENANEGTDLVQSSITYTLTDNVENLTLTSTANVNGTGNVLNNIIIGNTSANTLYGLEGNDTLNGGAGNDTIYGGYGDDTYKFGIGSGNDTIYDYDKTKGNLDTVEFGAGITKNDLELVKEGNHLRITINGTENTLLIDNWFTNKYYKIEQFKFADGTTLASKEIESLGYKVIMYGTAGDDSLSGTGSEELIIHGYAGNDTIKGNNGNDTIYGGVGNDTVYGNAGNDILDGGAGNDILYGGRSSKTGAGNDTYRFGMGSGQDTIYDYDKTKGNLDIVSMSSDISSENIVFMKEGNDLLIFSNINDFVRVSSEFTSTYYGIERLEVSDGKYVTRQDIENIVNSIAETNVTTGVDFVQQYNNLLNNQTYIASLTQSWHQPV
ncbi:MAG: hypothetical protein KKC21_02470, partial [Nitrospinae bacterium]|nr:hypothetical protein [Nitrospinota bacterium]